jgi:hypothetical protein
LILKSPGPQGHAHPLAVCHQAGDLHDAGRFQAIEDLNELACVADRPDEQEMAVRSSIEDGKDRSIETAEASSIMDGL